jgi:MFS-type transporter involved in bile tolerance (Atg22 family)
MAIPWQLLEQHRPGQALPAGANYFTIGFKNFWMAIKELRHLTQASIYLVAFFIITDTVTTTTTVTTIMQNTYIAYSVKQLNYFLILQYASCGLGILTYWYVQRAFNLTTKTMCLASAGSTILIGLWGFIGIWTDKIGFHNIWEFWVWSAVDGWMMLPWYQIGFTMIADVVPVGKTFLFFSLFGIMGKTSAFVGPFITSAIITRMDGNSNGLFLCLC